MTNDTIPIPITQTPKYEIMPTGLAIRDPLTFDEWLDCGHVLWRIKQSMQWCIGDWLVYGERQYGEMYAQALDETGYRYGSLRNMLYVAGKIELSRRRDNLSWSHHYEIASLEDSDQDRIITEAIEQEWSVKESRQQIRKEPLLLDIYDKQYTDLATAIARIRSGIWNRDWGKVREGLTMLDDILAGMRVNEVQIEERD